MGARAVVGGGKVHLGGRVKKAQARDDGVLLADRVSKGGKDGGVIVVGGGRGHLYQRAHQRVKFAGVQESVVVGVEKLEGVGLGVGWSPPGIKRTNKHENSLPGTPGWRAR